MGNNKKQQQQQQQVVVLSNNNIAAAGAGGGGVGSNWDIRCSFHSLIAAVLVLVLVSGAVYLMSSESSGHFLLQVDPNLSSTTTTTSSSSSSSSNTNNNNNNNKSLENSDEECELFSGKWVYDNISYPLYREKECIFMSDQLACEKFGRKDLGYRYWRWQPHRCNLPKFNGTVLLEKLRNKRMVFVGDSLNRGQWVSMVCLLQTSISSSSSRRKSLFSMHNNGSNLIEFKVKEYNASIDFYWAPLLVESNSDDPVNHRLPERIVRAHAIHKHAKHWTNSDFLVFNTYLWWKRPKMKILWGSFDRSDDDDDGVYKEVEMLRSYEMAMKTWSEWLEFHIDHNRTQMFFMSMSPTHERAEEWGRSEGENCYKESEMIRKVNYRGNGSDSRMMKIVEDAIDDLRRKEGGLINIQMINITELSEYRKEGHPSIYRKQWEPLTEEQMSDPYSYADCIHWCLPGVPDVWNELLYAYIFNYHINPIKLED